MKLLTRLANMAILSALPRIGQAGLVARISRRSSYAPVGS